MSFLFAVLGSVVFWGVYIGISLFAGTYTMKSMAKDTFAALTRTSRSLPDPVSFTLIALAHYIFWPILIVSMLVSFIGSRVLFPLFSKLIVAIDEAMPTIKVKSKSKSKSKNRNE